MIMVTNNSFSGLKYFEGGEIGALSTVAHLFPVVGYLQDSA